MDLLKEPEVSGEKMVFDFDTGAAVPEKAEAQAYEQEVDLMNNLPDNPLPSVDDML